MTYVMKMTKKEWGMIKVTRRTVKMIMTRNIWVTGKNQRERMWVRTLPWISSGEDWQTEMTFGSNDCSINFHLSKLSLNSPYCMIYLWWETERENWSWSLLAVKGLIVWNFLGGVGWKTGGPLATNPNALVSKAQFLVTLVTHWYAISQHELIQFFFVSRHLSRKGYWAGQVFAWLGTRSGYRHAGLLLFCLSHMHYCAVAMESHKFQYLFYRNFIETEHNYAI